MVYETEYSNFPNEIIAPHDFKNVDNKKITYTNSSGRAETDTAINLINKINTLRQSSNSSDKAEAANLIRNLGNKIKPYLVDAETFNTLEQEIYNAQIFAQEVTQSIHFSTNQPAGCKQDDVWIGSGNS